MHLTLAKLLDPKQSKAKWLSVTSKTITDGCWHARCPAVQSRIPSVHQGTCSLEFLFSIHRGWNYIAVNVKKWIWFQINLQIEFKRMHHVPVVLFCYRRTAGHRTHLTNFGLAVCRVWKIFLHCSGRLLTIFRTEEGQCLSTIQGSTKLQNKFRISVGKGKFMHSY